MVVQWVASKVPAALAKPMIKGAMQELSKEWTIEWFRECAEKDGGVADIVEVPGWYPKLVELLDAHPSLRQTSLFEVMNWIKDKKGNPALYEALVPDPLVMSWLARAWKKFMAGEGAMSADRRTTGTT